MLNIILIRYKWYSKINFRNRTGLLFLNCLISFDLASFSYCGVTINYQCIYSLNYFCHNVSSRNYFIYILFILQIIFRLLCSNSLVMAKKTQPQAVQIFGHKVRITWAPILFIFCQFILNSSMLIIVKLDWIIFMI